MKTSNTNCSKTDYECKKEREKFIRYEISNSKVLYIKPMLQLYRQIVYHFTRCSKLRDKIYLEEQRNTTESHSLNPICRSYATKTKNRIAPSFLSLYDATTASRRCCFRAQFSWYTGGRFYPTAVLLRIRCGIRPDLHVSGVPRKKDTEISLIFVVRN